MAEDHHTIPLAPPRIYPRSDEESSAMPIPKHINSRRRQKSSKCFVFILSLIVSLSIALLVFSLVVLRFNSPRVKLESVEIKNLDYTSDSLNMSMVAELTIKNKNFGRLKLQNSSAIVFYGNSAIGSGTINGGNVIKGRETQRMNFTIQVKANGLGRENSNFSSEISSGLLKLSSYAKLRGEIRVLKKIIRRRTAILNCTMNLKLSSQEIQDLRCL